jgi:hypothetical protein
VYLSNAPFPSGVFSLSARFVHSISALLKQHPRVPAHQFGQISATSKIVSFSEHVSLCLTPDQQQQPFSAIKKPQDRWEFPLAAVMDA